MSLHRERATLPLLVCLCTLIAAVATAAPVDLGTPPSMGGLKFAADVTVAPSADGGGVVRINYAVTHDALHFLRHEGRYRARYEITAILYDEDGEQVTGDSWRRSATVDTYDETNARSVAHSEVFEFSVVPGEYALKFELVGLDTRARGTVQRRVVVPEMRPGELTIGSIVFEREDGDGDGGFSTALNPARVYGEDHPHARVTVPIYGTPGSTFAIEVSVLDDRGVHKKGRSDTLEQTGFETEYVYEFGVLDMEIGPYVIRADVRPLPDGDESTVRSRFRVVTSPLSWGEDQEKMIAQIGYVATRAEMELLTSYPPEERDAAWEEFWANRDPDPLTPVNEFQEEFLRRLAHANSAFRSIVEGWQTDMGRVYIQYGEPDDVESQPIGQMLHAWEIWYYYGEHTKYVFVDRDGFGEFVLHETSRI